MLINTNGDCMKKCQCLRYAALLANRKDEISYVFIDNALVPIESAYPLEDFETGTGALKCVCPFYNFIHNGTLISRAFDQMLNRTLRKEDYQFIEKAVENCENLVDIKKFLIFSERYKEIIELFCKKNEQKPIVRLLKHFLSFIHVRTQYMDKTLCNGVSPAEKKKCFDDLWVEGFERYLNDVGFTFIK
jgi:hypothetical protein